MTCKVVNPGKVDLVQCSKELADTLANNFRLNYVFDHTVWIHGGHLFRACIP